MLETFWLLNAPRRYKIVDGAKLKIVKENAGNKRRVEGHFYRVGNKQFYANIQRFWIHDCQQVI